MTLADKLQLLAGDADYGVVVSRHLPALARFTLSLVEAWHRDDWRNEDLVPPVLGHALAELEREVCGG